MTTLRITFIGLLLSLASAFGQYQLPPLGKSVEDPSTSFNVQPGFGVDLIYNSPVAGVAGNEEVHFDPGGFSPPVAEGEMSEGLPESCGP